jgi:hypothetical protein
VSNNNRTFSALTVLVSTFDLAGQVPELTVAGCYAPPRSIKLYENLLEMVLGGGGVSATSESRCNRWPPAQPRQLQLIERSILAT